MLSIRLFDFLTALLLIVAGVQVYLAGRRRGDRWSKWIAGIVGLFLLVLSVLLITGVGIDVLDALLSRNWGGLLIALLIAFIGWQTLSSGRRKQRKLLALSLKGFAVILLGVSLLLAVGSLFTVFKAKRARAQFPAPGKMVDVGGYRMHILCAGESHDLPTVVWIPGAHAQGLFMNHLHKKIALETRSCIYDRASSGWSDIGPFPKSIETETRELKTLLERAGEKGPFVLVGHSFGGFLAVNFAGYFPNEVAGLVLLDPTPPNFMVGNKSMAPCSLLRSTFAIQGWVGTLGVSWFMDYAEINALYKGLEDVEPAIKANEAMPRSGHGSASALWAACGEDPMGVNTVRVPGALGDMPLYVLSPKMDRDALRASTRTQAVAKLPEFQRENYIRLMQDNQMQCVRLSRRGELRNTPEETGHLFPYQAPDFTLSQVHDMLSHLRVPMISETEVSAAREEPR